MRDLHPNGPITWPYSQPGPVANGPSGGSGSCNVVNATVDFGSGKSNTSATVTVTGQTWVTALSSIAVSFTGTRAEDAAVEGLTATIGNIVAGTGFTVYASSPLGSVGTYTVSCVGV